MKKLRMALCIIIGAALCCGWCYLKADTLRRETKMVTNLFKGE